MKGYRQLGWRDRVKIEMLREGGTGVREAARWLGRAPSTISRELKRNGRAAGGYGADGAQQAAGRRRRGCPRCLIRPPCFEESRGSPQWQWVEAGLCAGWSAQRIAGRYGVEHGGQSLSTETVYRYVQREALRGRRLADWPWRVRRRRRRRRPAATPRWGMGLDLRPRAANERSAPGHWEADVLCFRRPGAVVLHSVDRFSRFRFALKLPSKQAGALADSLLRAFEALPRVLHESLTVDRGSEFAQWGRLKEELGLPTYFCAPYSAWQKGTVENLNGVLRRYLPRHADLDTLDQEELTDICELLNDTPMKILGYRTPREVLHSELGLSVALHL